MDQTQSVAGDTEKMKTPMKFSAIPHAFSLQHGRPMGKREAVIHSFVAQTAETLDFPRTYALESESRASPKPHVVDP